MLPRLRRARTALAVALTALALLTACTGPAQPTDPAPAPSGPWTFTDDLGTTVRLDAAPTRVAGLSDVLYSLVGYGLAPVASFGWSSLADDVRFDGLDTAGIAETGATYGEIDLEALAAAAPELIVTHAYPSDASGVVDRSAPLYGFADLEQQRKVAAIAPIVAITMGGSGVEVIARTTELATALGADPDRVARARADFDAAGAALTAAAANGVTVAALYGETSDVYVAKAADDPSLRMYADLGLRFVEPQTDAYYWDVLSWERFDTVRADLVLYSERGYGVEELLAQPTVAASPVGRARQLEPWVFAGMDYVSQAAYLTRLAGFVADAEVVTG